MAWYFWVITGIGAFAAALTVLSWIYSVTRRVTGRDIDRRIGYIEAKLGEIGDYLDSRSRTRARKVREASGKAKAKAKDGDKNNKKDNKKNKVKQAKAPRGKGKR